MTKVLTLLAQLFTGEVWTAPSQSRISKARMALLQANKTLAEQRRLRERAKRVFAELEAQRGERGR